MIMQITRFPFLAFAILLCLSSQGLAQSEPTLTDLKVLPLVSGVNKIHNFTPNGRDGLIIEGWRDNGNAHGYNVFVVMVPTPAKNGSRWDIVGVRSGTKFEDRLSDDPHTVEDYVRSIRFAKGKINGTEATLLITAERQFSNGDNYLSPMNVTISIYKLIPRPHDELIGATTFIFDRIMEKRTEERYCNSDLALAHVLKLPLPEPYSGPNKNDGCP
jgi:hypothetical protein